MAVIRDELVVEEDLARRLALDADEHAPDRGLAAARLTDQAEGLTLGDRETDVRHRVHGADLVSHDAGLDRELLDQALDADDLVGGPHADFEFRASNDDRFGTVDREETGVGVGARRDELRVIDAAPVLGVRAARREADSRRPAW